MKMKIECPYKGNQGSYYAHHRKTEEKVIRIWSEHSVFTKSGLRYHDAVFTADTTNPAFADARDHLLTADKVLMAESMVDELGNPIWKHKAYIALWRIENCRVEADGLHFDFVERLAEYK